MKYIVYFGGTTSMIFKEQLTAKAEKLNIEKDVKYIKERMEECYACRKYTVSLIKSYTNMAIGSANSNRTSLFVPHFVSPEYYLKLFVDAFKDLGFTEEDMTFTYADNEYYESYDIILKW
jgi:hypothetical protein